MQKDDYMDFLFSLVCFYTIFSILLKDFGFMAL